MTVYPNAKINLGLSVVRRREDGYHDLETVFLPVHELHDVLEVNKLEADVPSEGYRFEQEGIAVDCPPEENLIIRTYLKMRERYEKVGAVSIRFEKHIPFGAGLGGGSADAAFMAKAVNELFELGLSDEELEEEVSPLGADCAFFIQNRPRYAEGIGNVFGEVDPRIMEAIQGKWLLLVKPACAVSTGQAYRGIVTREAKALSNKELHKGDSPYCVISAEYEPFFDGRLESLKNDFEETVFPLFPEIEQVKEILLATGARYAAMSGSGATVFGLYDEEVEEPEKIFEDCFVHQERI